MAKIKNGTIILSEEESKRLWQDILHPDLEAIKKEMPLLKIQKIGVLPNWKMDRK